MHVNNFLYKALPVLRVLLGILSLGCFIAIAISLRMPTSPPPLQNDGSFPSSVWSDPLYMGSQQLGVNAILFIASIYSFFGRREWSPVNRIALAWILTMINLIYAVSLLFRIRQLGGCSGPVYGQSFERCNLQVGICSTEIAWALLLIMESVITFRRSRDPEYLTKLRVQEEERIAESAIRYQPDLSLYGNSNANASNNRLNGGPESGPSAVEMEPLPAYMPHRPKDQPYIIDMADRPGDIHFYTPPNHPAPDYTAIASSSRSSPGPSSTPGPATAAASGSSSAQTSSTSASPADPTTAPAISEPFPSTTSTSTASPAPAIPSAAPPTYVP